MKFSHNGFNATIRRNRESDKEFWIYTIRRNESDNVVYQGFANTALEAVETVEECIRLETKKSA